MAGRTVGLCQLQSDTENCAESADRRGDGVTSQLHEQEKALIALSPDLRCLHVDAGILECLEQRRKRRGLNLLHAVALLL